ncbi:chemotaxis protein CheD [Acidocella sp.]|uniref:chemotaxis protein CheD n=1 Tax=Acidocella sp. TaxID=50710 RepID=UPI00343CA728
MITTKINFAVERRIHVAQGEHCVVSEPDTVLTTLLGSCIAACLWDPVAGVGGMNHFLLPGSGRAGGHAGGDARRYGVNLMELLINDLLRHGGRKARLKAKLFGGAAVVKGLTDIGALNASFAEDFLSGEGIELVGGSLRGSQGRRVQFWPVTGRARQAFLTAEAAHLLREEAAQPPATLPGAGQVELF